MGRSRGRPGAIVVKYISICNEVHVNTLIVCVFMTTSSVGDEISMCVCIYVACMYICRYVYMYSCIYLRVYMCMYAYTYVCT